MWKRFAMALTALVALSAPLSAQPESGLAPTEAFVENPSSGARLYVQLYRPHQTGIYPSLVLIPGGNGAGSQSFRAPEAQGYADAGFLTFVFDPDGRGRSSGSENYNGFIQQDGLKAVIEYAASHPQSDGRVVLVSNSYGVTMATGVLARYPELPVAFYVDWEGPANRNDTGGCDGQGKGHLSQFSCTDETFWVEREASTFIQQIQVPYQRVQSQQDHVQSDNTHAILLVNNATNSAYGGAGVSPWTRLNDLAPNQVYAADYDAGWWPESARTAELITYYLKQFLSGEIAVARQTRSRSA